MELIVLFFVLALFGVLLVSATYTVGGDPFFFLKKRVYLLDYWGKIRYSREYRPGIAYVYPGTRVGPVRLHSDGTTSGSGYIERWSYNLKELIS